MSAVNRSIIAFILIITSACATTERGRFLERMAYAGALGVALGQAQTRSKGNYSLMYGGLLASGTAVMMTLNSKDHQDLERLRLENKKLQELLNGAEGGRVVHEAPGTLSGHVPSKYRGLIDPGEWRIYAIDQWIEDGENRLIHQDKIMELKPPALVPKSFKPKN